MSRNILIIKLGAMGDVLRTTPLLAVYKRAEPGCRITWITDPVSLDLLSNNPLIDDLRANDPATIRWLVGRHFDLAVNLDKDPPALDLMRAASASIRQGFGWDERRANVVALNSESEYAVRLGVDDTLKFRLNTKTYQEISHEQLGLRFAGDEYGFAPDPSDRSAAGDWLASLGVAEGRAGVGVNTGSGERFAGKKLPLESLINLSRILWEKTGKMTVLLGGPSERERNEYLADQCRGFAVNAGTGHSIRRFAAIVEKLPLVITGDTIAMHVAIAVRVPTLVLFGSTCEAEIELYGRGKKIISSLACAPCYKRVCPAGEICMDPPDFAPERIAAEALGLIPAEVR